MNFRSRHFLLLLFTLLLAIHSPAQTVTYAGYGSIKDYTAFKQKYSSLSAKIISMKADFRQEKTLSSLSESITSKGTFWFKRNDKVRMDYTTPFVYRLIINGDKISMKDSQKENKVNVKSNKLFQSVNQLIVDCIQGKIIESKNFTTRAFENDSDYLLELTPTTKNLKEFFQTIVLIIDKKEGSPKSIQLNEPYGDTTLLTFTGKVINSELPDAIFSF